MALLKILGLVFSLSYHSCMPEDEAGALNSFSANLVYTVSGGNGLQPNNRPLPPSDLEEVLEVQVPEKEKTAPPGKFGGTCSMMAACRYKAFLKRYEPFGLAHGTLDGVSPVSYTHLTLPTKA